MGLDERVRVRVRVVTAWAKKVGQDAVAILVCEILRKCDVSISNTGIDKTICVPIMSSEQ